MYPLFVITLNSFLFAGKNEKMPVLRQQPNQDLTEEELARYVQELQKHQVSVRRSASGAPSEALLAIGVPSALSLGHSNIKGSRGEGHCSCPWGQIQV